MFLSSCGNEGFLSRELRGLSQREPLRRCHCTLEDDEGRFEHFLKCAHTSTCMYTCIFGDTLNVFGDVVNLRLKA